MTSTRSIPIILHVLQFLLLSRTVCALQQPTPVEGTTSRRNAVAAIVSGAISLPFLSTVNAANAATTATTGRDQLLNAIARQASDEEMFQIIQNLKDPTVGKTLASAYPGSLEGQWELIWSYKAESFSPLLKLPKPFRPESYQYFGSTAAAEVGEGRIAQGLTGGVLGRKQLWLSSGAVPLVGEDPSVLEIQPPFRFELGGRYGSGQPKKTLVDAGSDADFREINARNKEAQLAPRNKYKQLYLENNGPGSLRVSSLVEGDPVIVGLTLIHRKL